MNENQTVNISPGEMHIDTALKIYDALDKVGKAEFVTSLGEKDQNTFAIALRTRRLERSKKKGMPEGFNLMCR